MLFFHSCSLAVTKEEEKRNRGYYISFLLFCPCSLAVKKEREKKKKKLECYHMLLFLLFFSSCSLAVLTMHMFLDGFLKVISYTAPCFAMIMTVCEGGGK